MDTISISEFKALCLRLLREVKESGKTLLITRDNEPIAIVSPPPKVKSRGSAFGCMKHRTKIKSDLTAPLSEVEWDVLK